MAKEKKTKGKLPWHSAFYAGLQIELEEEAYKLTFENEHQLGTDPMRIDVLIIKKYTEEQIQKNIGQIFREYNIIEYKSPEQYLSIDAFYKVLGYACFYKADVQYVDIIKAEKITISYVSKRIVTSKLSEEDNFWLKNLTNDLKEKSEADKMFEEYGKHSDSKLHKSVMDLIMQANERIFKEAKGNMCNALRELFKEEIDEAKKDGIKELVVKKLAKGKSVEQIADELEQTVEMIEELIKSIEK